MAGAGHTNAHFLLLIQHLQHGTRQREGEKAPTASQGTVHMVRAEPGPRRVTPTGWSLGSSASPAPDPMSDMGNHDGCGMRRITVRTMASTRDRLLLVCEAVSMLDGVPGQGTSMTGVGMIGWARWSFCFLLITTKWMCLLRIWQEQFPLPYEC